MEPHDNSLRPLNVSIVGAGIGGLAAALSLRRKGHRIKIFELSPYKTELGAGIGMQINALRVLQRFGLARENLKATNFDGAVVFDAKSDGAGTTRPWLVHRPDEVYGLFCHRSDLHNELKRLALGEGEGPPAQLHLNSKVVACDPEAGTVTLADNEIIHADVVIGADGIHSVVRTSILGHAVKAPASGLSCFRCLLNASTLNQLPEVEWLTEGISGVRTIMLGGGTPLWFIIYPCRSETLINFVGFYPDPDQDDPDWTSTATREDIMETFRDFHPRFLHLFDLPTESPILKWQLRALPLLPTWICGRAALLGDAAHATMPLLGQGAAMAIEDAAALGCLLPLGTTREEVPARLAAYQTIRKERADFINSESVAQALPAKRGQAIGSREMQALLTEYDVIKIAQEYFDTHFSGSIKV
ncbi:FAD/NAD(P)-binding domain-containing protein [Mycena epipterygia]|nr:FAD/NAD(P)-binding domain-containing protein [Mycena epipterygia]